MLVPLLESRQWIPTIGIPLNFIRKDRRDFTRYSWYDIYNMIFINHKCYRIIPCTTLRVGTQRLHTIWRLSLWEIFLKYTLNSNISYFERFLLACIPYSFAYRYMRYLVEQYIMKLENHSNRLPDAEWITLIYKSTRKRSRKKNCADVYRTSWPMVNMLRWFLYSVGFRPRYTSRKKLPHP